MSKRYYFIILTLLILLGIAGVIYFVKIVNNQEIPREETVRSKCLGKDEIADYEFRIKKTPLADVNIFSKNKNTQKIINSFQIENVRKNYYPIEMHKCGVYVIRMFNYDSQKIKQYPGYKAELWKYDYTGKGEFALLFHEKISKDGEKIYKSYYGTDFRIDPSEKHIALKKWTITELDEGGYVDEKDRSIAIKDLKTKEDIFVLLAKDIVKQYPNIIGSIGLKEWTDDGRYFWGDIFQGAYVVGYFRVDTQEWKTDIFEAPDGAMGGFPLNINTGYVPIQPGQVWTGFYEFTQELKEQYKEEGKKSKLYLYNLFTKEKILIETTDEPLFWFKPKWLSDTELEYTLPSGEKKVYEIKAD